MLHTLIFRQDVANSKDAISYINFFGSEIRVNAFELKDSNLAFVVAMHFIDITVDCLSFGNLYNIYSSLVIL